MSGNVTFVFACCHENLVSLVPSYFMFNTCVLALANPEHWWHWLATFRRFLIPLE